MDLILSGRSVNAKEALDIGLANKLVSNGQVLYSALLYATQLINFPQTALLCDRISAYNTYNYNSIKDALAAEYSLGLTAIQKDLGIGAKKFEKGSGRKGSFQEFQTFSKQEIEELLVNATNLPIKISEEISVAKSKL